MSFVRLTIFDLDHTLLNANCSFRFGYFLYQKKIFSIWALLACGLTYARHKWLGLPVYQLHSKTFHRLFKGCDQSDLHQHVTQFLNASLKSMLNETVFQRLKQAQAQGEQVHILSSSPDFLVKEIAARLQVVNWGATIYESDADGKLSGIKLVMEGPDKAVYLKNLMTQSQIPSSALTVYSDSYLDLPILKMAGKAIAVGPDSHLKRICLINDWEIL